MAEQGDPILEIDRIRKSFGDFHALKDVSLNVAESEVVSIVGPSGSGKSTLLRAVNLLEDIDEGGIYFKGQLLGLQRTKGGYTQASAHVKARQRKNFGMVFQQFNLFPHLTVLENQVMPQVKVLGTSKAQAIERATRRLAEVGLSEKRDAYPSELSGGQQQRVAIARALCMDPAIMLFDEPTSALDPELVGEVLDVIRGIAGRGTTMMVVTHEMDFARRVSSRMVFMDHGEIVEEGPPMALTVSPRTERAARFFSAIRNRT